MRGGKRPGAGRPLIGGIPRKQRQVRATDAEWQMIKLFADLIKKSDQNALNFIKSLDR